MRVLSKESGVGSESFEESVREHLARLLQSRGFVNARQLSAFLTYTVEETLAGRAALIKETTIGVDVFGRPPSFDPRVDPIVRVQATKLRARLKEFYESEGAAERLRVSFPKGAYVPVFEERAPDAVPAAQAAPRRWRRIWLLAFAVCAAVAAVAAGFFLRPSGGPHSAPSIAVLPFVSIGPQEVEYFADGLTEELIASLGPIPGLRAVARTSVFENKGKQQDVRQISARLAAAHILEGTVRWDGDQVRVTARLVDGHSGYQLWTSAYTRERTGLFAVQIDLARDIVAAMRVHLAPAASPARRVPDPEAYRLYLQGRYFWRSRDAEGLEKARRRFEMAIDCDPGFAAAYAGLADTYSQMVTYELATPNETREPALASARRGVELAPDSAEAQTALGYALAVFALDWKNSEQAFRRAIRLNPAYADARRWFVSMCLLFFGRLDEALSEVRMAASLDPISVYAQTDLGRVLSARGDYRGAAAEFRKAIELAPRHPRAHTELGFALERMGDFAAAEESFQRAVDVSGGHPAFVADLARFYAASGKPARARALLEEIEGKAGPYHLAAVHAALGDRDRAFAELDSALASRLLPRVLLNRYESLRADPRFGRFLGELAAAGGSPRGHFSRSISLPAIR